MASKVAQEIAALLSITNGVELNDLWASQTSEEQHPLIHYRPNNFGRGGAGVARWVVTCPAHPTFFPVASERNFLVFDKELEQDKQLQAAKEYATDIYEVAAWRSVSLMDGVSWVPTDLANWLRRTTHAAGRAQKIPA